MCISCIDDTEEEKEKSCYKCKIHTVLPENTCFEGNKVPRKNMHGSNAKFSFIREGFYK